MYELDRALLEKRGLENDYHLLKESYSKSSNDVVEIVIQGIKSALRAGPKSYTVPYGCLVKAMSLVTASETNERGGGTDAGADADGACGMDDF